MPELPEVETVVRGLRRKIVGKRIDSVRILMPQIIRSGIGEFRNQVRGQKICDVKRRGKFILIGLENGWTLAVHLKMTGRLNWTNESEPVEKHTHIIFHMTSCPYSLHYCDVRRFGYLMLFRTDRLTRIRPFRDLGPEPLDITETAFRQSLAARTGHVKSLLLNQHFLAGIGNIYADEILWSSRVHPLTAANRISNRKTAALREHMRNILKAAIAHGGSTVDSYKNTDNRPGRHQFHLKVYGREGESCLHCGSRIKRLVIGGRSSHYCPRCQRPPRGHSF